MFHSHFADLSFVLGRAMYNTILWILTCVLAVFLRMHKEPGIGLLKRPSTVSATLVPAMLKPSHLSS